MSWGRIVRIFLLSSGGLLILYFTVVTGLLPQYLSYIWPTVYYTEVFADVTAEGERYQLRSVAKCTLRAKARFGGLVAGDTPKVITAAFWPNGFPPARA